MTSRPLLTSLFFESPFWILDSYSLRLWYSAVLMRLMLLLLGPLSYSVFILDHPITHPETKICREIIRVLDSLEITYFHFMSTFPGKVIFPVSRYRGSFGLGNSLRDHSQTTSPIFGYFSTFRPWPPSFMIVLLSLPPPPLKLPEPESNIAIG